MNDPGCSSRIPDPDSDFLPIPDPGIKKALDPGSRIRIRNTATICRLYFRDDLGLYLKVLRSSMIELINEDYADFVNLSTNLVGLDTVILRLKEPLLKHQARALDQALKLCEPLPCKLCRGSGRFSSIQV
jgi:hypothetical protein